MLAQDGAHAMLRGRKVEKQRSPQRGRNQNRRLNQELLDFVKSSLALLAPIDLCMLLQELEDRFADRHELCDEPTDILQAPEQASDFFFSPGGSMSTMAFAFIGSTSIPLWLMM